MVTRIKTSQNPLFFANFDCFLQKTQFLDIFFVRMKEQQINLKKSKYNGFHTTGKNFIWAGAMCLAWQELKQNVIKSPIKLHTKDEYALNIIDNFNNSNFLKKDLSPDGYYVKSGFGSKTVQMINKQVSKKFKQKSLPKLELELEQNELISYAYIFKKFDFLSKFELQQKGTFHFQKEKVNSFYAKTKEQKRNVFYFSYENQDDFVIGIKGKDQNDSIFFIKSEKELETDEVIKSIIHYENKGARRYLTAIDEFEMPIVKIEAKREIEEIQGLKFANKGFTDKYLAKATQMLKIEINESGAKFENAAYIAMKCKKSQKDKPKRFLLNNRFWIVMKQPHKHPYLCMKVAKPIQEMKIGKQ